MAANVLSSKYQQLRDWLYQINGLVMSIRKNVNRLQSTNTEKMMVNCHISSKQFIAPMLEMQTWNSRCKLMKLWSPPRDNFYWHWLPWITAQISNYIHYKVWHEITVPLRNFSNATVEVWEWIVNFIHNRLGLWLLILTGIKVNPC